MHNTTTFCRILLWIVLVLVCAVQIMTIVSIQINNANAIEGEAYDKVLSIVPLIVAAVLLLGGAVLFEVFPKRGYIGLILCAVAGIIFFIYAFSIRDAFPVHIGADGKDTGVTTARMIWRHMSPVFVPILMLVVWLLERSMAKEEPAAKSHFDLSGGPLFKDEDGGSAKAGGMTAAQLAGAAGKRKKIRD